MILISRILYNKTHHAKSCCSHTSCHPHLLNHNLTRLQTRSMRRLISKNKRSNRFQRGKKNLKALKCFLKTSSSLPWLCPVPMLSGIWVIFTEVTHNQPKMSESLCLPPSKNGMLYSSQSERSAASRLRLCSFLMVFQWWGNWTNATDVPRNLYFKEFVQMAWAQQVA